MRRRPTVVLGASGLVGQHMQQRLSNHPWFVLAAIGGQTESSEMLPEQNPWRLDEQRPELPSIPIFDISGETFVNDLLELEIEVAFSCLPSDVAERIEGVLAQAGIAVFSNASFNRRKPGIPLVIPDINAEHFTTFSTIEGPIACGTNCTLIPLAVPLAALRTFGIQRVTMRSEQALSGAGWRLLFDEDANNGILEPEIPGEAEKVAEELLHVFGTAEKPAEIELDISCQRVERRYGHQVFVEAVFNQVLSLDSVLQAFSTHQFPDAMLKCPSAPLRPIHVVEHIDVKQHLWSNGERFSTHPQPHKDLQIGMSVVVGDVKLIDEYTLSFSAYSHNTIRGAAGGTMLLAEQAIVEGHIH
ncbi:MAG: hypothetical protein HOA11_06965 [Euryarchaeota archaeon]|nr:hypothetical protein [Euryarchaeota archaeon]